MAGLREDDNFVEAFATANNSGGPAHALVMGEGPVEFARLAVEGSGLEFAAVDAQHGHDLGVIARDEDLVGVREILVAQGALDHARAVVPQELNDPLAGDAVEE